MKDVPTWFHDWYERHSKTLQPTAEGVSGKQIVRGWQVNVEKLGSTIPDFPVLPITGRSPFTHPDDEEAEVSVQVVYHVQRSQRFLQDSPFLNWDTTSMDGEYLRHCVSVRY